MHATFAGVDICHIQHNVNKNLSARLSPFFHIGDNVDICRMSTVLPEIGIILWLFMIPRIHQLTLPCSVSFP